MFLQLLLIAQNPDFVDLPSDLSPEVSSVLLNLWLDPIQFLQRFKCTISEALIGAIGAEEVTVEVLEEDVDGLLPPLVHRVASPGESGG